MRQCDATCSLKPSFPLNSSQRVFYCWLNLYSCLDGGRKSQLCCDVTDTCVWSAVTQNCAVPFHQLARVDTKSSPRLIPTVIGRAKRVVVCFSLCLWGSYSLTCWPIWMRFFTDDLLGGPNAFCVRVCSLRFCLKKAAVDSAWYGVEHVPILTDRLDFWRVCSSYSHWDLEHCSRRGLIVNSVGT